VVQFSDLQLLPRQYVPSRATQAQSVERRWRRFLGNQRVRVSQLYLPLVMAALSGWKQHRLYLALDTTVLWNRYCNSAENRCNLAKNAARMLRPYKI
jgi:hypothetical protein